MALCIEEAIELYTLGSAYAEFMEDRKGIIKEGYLGDVVIFNGNLMTIPHDQIMSAKVDYTIVGGKVVYKREGSEKSFGYRHAYGVSKILRKR